ncbi:hypothetical protein D9758_016250 [Tetrapyrgos nigripes]|uniref:Uncharacterized protein n=1 Tax=Tetrapyrgos nigripes TaxID=182062 RepID=A0A8H5BZC8_9AGAR|nr:hypothetical protein D9758_016250 [Tetrapyrgos nigripes]
MLSMVAFIMLVTSITRVSNGINRTRLKEIIDWYHNFADPAISYSWVKPRWYTKIFFTCDLLALVSQGTLASGDDVSPTLLNIGEKIMLYSIVASLVIIAIFAILALDFLRRHAHRKPVRPMSTDETPRERFQGPIRKLIYAYGCQHLPSIRSVRMRELLRSTDLA